MTHKTEMYKKVYRMKAEINNYLCIYSLVIILLSAWQCSGQCRVQQSPRLWVGHFI